MKNSLWYGLPVRRRKTYGTAVVLSTGDLQPGKRRNRIVGLTIFQSIGKVCAALASYMLSDEELVGLPIAVVVYVLVHC